MPILNPTPKIPNPIKKYGIPYLGSKSTSAKIIFNKINELHPDKPTLHDPFCGGYAISQIFIENGYKVISSDVNPYLTSLLNKITKPLTEEVYNFIDRQTFIDVKTNPDKYPSWYVGFVLSIWSFGNTGQGYLYGKTIEHIKKAGHLLVVNKEPADILNLVPNLEKADIDTILNESTIRGRRILLNRLFIILCKQKDALELDNVRNLERLEHLEHLARLERLEHLEPANEILTQSYLDIKPNTNDIIYLDPPYQNTAGYMTGDFDHAEFWNWVRKLSKTNKVYISEYTAPDDFTCILEFEKASTLSGGTNKNTPNEKLWTLNSI